ncbi:unnamed protein product [Rotaria sordida]|uniref:Beta-1,4-galactosyltransferase n=1 Tax=Rotaria sordida TaxID=392033 RepID=A0A815CZ58_9BILA|nr:unnamed protein product [Rotaria sordida]CAF1290258.1 unnamed protein product [Rotaria sordida]
MLSRSKFNRFTRNEYLREIIIIIIVIIIIHICNTYYEYTGNQYILIDNDHLNEFCPLYPSTLQGSKEEIIMLEKVEWSDNPNVQIGGIYSPNDCKSRQELAIIIPFRNREYHLKLLLKYLHPFLQRQKRSYQIFVVEQIGNVTFNKGIIMNVAFQQALNIRSTFNCFIFHDVDLVPENDYNVYECDQKAPRHLSPAVDELRYVLMYNHLVGGVLALSEEQFISVNGWSNLYWGWGAEDDDMAQRIRNSSYRLSRPPNHIGRYKMIRHEKRERAVNRHQLLQGWTRYLHDGIKQLNQVDYTIENIHKEKLFTHILVNITRLSSHKLEYLLQ